MAGKDIEGNEIKEKKAEELFKEFREVSITEFFRKNKAHLGYSGKVRSLTTVIHEVVTNSLDACEEAGILPDIEVEIRELGPEYYLLVARDNGPGIPIKHIANVFGKMLAGTKFHRNVQLRGQQGIGVTGVTLFSQMTTGKPLRIRTSTGNGKVNEVKLMIDITKNNADILEQNEYSQYWRGTEIEGELKGITFNLSEHGPFEYLRRTAIANPHAKIIFIDPNKRKTIFERSSDIIPKPPIEVKPHPRGIEVDDLVNMSKKTTAYKIGSFLISEFSRISSAKVKEIEKVINEDRQKKDKHSPIFDINKNPRKLTWAECEEIISAIKKIKFLAPPMEGLQPIGKEQIRKAVLNILDPEFEVVVTRSPKVHSGGIPFQAEAAIAYGGHAGRTLGEGGVRAEVMRFANRAPLLFDAGGCAITKAVNDVDWKRYDIKDFENSPATVFVNIISTHVPYTSAGKQSIADDDEIIKEIKFALMDVGRKFESYYSKKRRSLEKEAKRQILLNYSTELAAGLSRITDKDEKKILNDLMKLVEEKLKLDAEMESLDEEEEEMHVEGELESEEE